jgi:hypothetical protein
MAYLSWRSYSIVASIYIIVLYVAAGILARQILCPVCAGRDLGWTDGPYGAPMRVVCGTCTPVPWPHGQSV